jgi:5-methylcytosine-specific restriction protein A
MVDCFIRGVEKMKNPYWTKDELIIALDVYERLNFWKHQPENTPEIKELSNTLNQLPVHSQDLREQNFRNPNSVYMKLCNFLRLDERYQGKGLDAGSKLDGIVWDEFVNDKDRLRKTAEVIRNGIAIIRDAPLESLEGEEFPEGRVLTRLHRMRERNPSLIKKKKDQELAKHSKLVCEVCGFDFKDFYGDIGEGFIECHHIIPLSELKETKTKISDLVLVCANCHRILHRARPWMSVGELREIIK